jgi:hypothetical protein
VVQIQLPDQIEFRNQPLKCVCVFVFSVKIQAGVFVKLHVKIHAAFVFSVQISFVRVSVTFFCRTPVSRYAGHFVKLCQANVCGIGGGLCSCVGNVFLSDSRLSLRWPSKCPQN